MCESTSLSDWLSGLSAGMAGLALICLGLSFVDADAADFDPRPAVARLVESGVFDPLLVMVANALYSVRAAVAASREFGRDVAALLILLCTSPKGAL